MQVSKRIILPVTIVISSLGGFLLRLFQRKHELLADGSVAEGAYLHMLLLILSAIFIATVAAIIWKLQPRTAWSQLSNRKMLPIIPLVAAAALLFANLVVLTKGIPVASPYVTSAPEFSNFLNHLLPPLGIVAAVCIALFSYKCFVGQRTSPALYMLVSLYLVIRLIVSFQAWNTDPSIHDYCYALLATISAMLATFHMAGFSFDKGKRRMSLFWIVCALFFCTITLADSIYDSDLSELLIYLSLILSLGFNLVQLLCGNEENIAIEE